RRGGSGGSDVLPSIRFQVDRQHLVGSEHPRHAGQNGTVPHLQRGILVVVHVGALQVVRRLHLVREHHGAEGKGRSGNVRYHQRRLKRADLAAFILPDNRLQSVFSGGHGRDLTLVEKIAGDNLFVGVVGHVDGQRIAKPAGGVILVIDKLPGKIEFRVV